MNIFLLPPGYVAGTIIPLNVDAVTIPEVFNDAALSIAYAVAALVDVDAVPVKLPVTLPVTLPVNAPSKEVEA